MDLQVFQNSQQTLVAECQAHFAFLRGQIETRVDDLKTHLEQMAFGMIEQTKKLEELYMRDFKNMNSNDVLSEEELKELVEQRKLFTRLFENNDIAQINSNFLIEFLDAIKLKQRQKAIAYGTKLNDLEMIRKNIIQHNEFESNLRFIFDRDCVGTLRLGNFSQDPLNSQILNGKQSVDLMKLCEFLPLPWRLLYRASKNGFNAEHFHAKCDGHRNTLTIVETQGGVPYVFGGYTSETWSSLGEWKTDKNAFVFSLINKRNKPVKISVDTLVGVGKGGTKRSQNDAIYCSSNYGPTFGRGHDLYIASDCNRNDNSYSYLGYTYRHTKYAQGSNEARTLFAGSLNFKVNEIEVYTQTGSE